jgi:hypothetical protein
MVIFGGNIGGKFFLGAKWHKICFFILKGKK